MSDQAFTDGQKRIGLRRQAGAHALLQNADGQSTDDIHHHDDDRRNRVPSNKLAGTVHGAIKVRFFRDILPAPPGFIFFNEACVQVGIDRHLLARHRIQCEAGGDFSHAAGALGHHHEIDDHEDRKHHEADGVIPADDKGAERADDFPCRRRSFIPMQQNQAGRRNIQGQPEERDHQENRGKYRKVHRPTDL